MSPNLDAGESVTTDVNGISVFPLKPSFPVVILAEHNKGYFYFYDYNHANY